MKIFECFSIENQLISFSGNHKWRKQELAFQRISPKIDIYNELRSISSSTITATGESYVTSEFKSLTDTITGNSEDLKTMSLYVEDDWSISKRFRMNVGLRYMLYMADGEKFHSIEPRLSLRWLFRDDMAIKASVSRMSQNMHLLSSSNLLMTSNVWVPITSSTGLLNSWQWALSYNYEIIPGIDASIEGYYKTMENVIDYFDGVSYSRQHDWKKMVAVGDGRSYGVELMLQKKSGKTNGWLSYTWSKALRMYDRKGSLVNAGAEFYDINDCRNNFNITVTHRFNEQWDVSASWSYRTGRRGNIANMQAYAGLIDEYNAYGSFADNSIHTELGTEDPAGTAFIQHFLRTYSCKGRNIYKMPDIHHLDIAVNYTLRHKVGQSKISLSIYNLYNHKNVSELYLSHDIFGRLVLRGVCPLPIIPSVQYTFSF